MCYFVKLLLKRVYCCGVRSLHLQNSVTLGKHSAEVLITILNHFACVKFKELVELLPEDIPHLLIFLVLLFHGSHYQVSQSHLFLSLPHLCNYGHHNILLSLHQSYNLFLLIRRKHLILQIVWQVDYVV